MQPEKLSELRQRVTDDLKDRLGTLQEHAEHFADQQVVRMVEEDKVLKLTEDEERMIRAYRQFLQRNASAVFSWRTSTPDALITEITTPCLIRDPCDVSSG